MLVLPWNSAIGLGVRIVMTLLGASLVALYVRRVHFNIVASGDKVYTRWAV